MITGAGSGIGRAVAERLHARGDALYLLARSAERAEELRADFPGAHTLIANLADPYTLADLSLDAWHVSLAVNLGSPAELTRLLLPRLRHPGGHVVFVNSTSGLKTQGEWAAYSAGKYGLRAIADCLRDEEGATGLRVTTVYPSRTATPMQERVNEYEGRAYEPERWIDPGTLASTIIAAIDLPADAEVADLTVRVGPGR
jgi:NAD(P)-dependent dehydrogenase (short-subunit alcohol dehydrogenase family)